jgi:hypothetical protein
MMLNINPIGIYFVIIGEGALFFVFFILPVLLELPGIIREHFNPPCKYPTIDLSCKQWKEIEIWLKKQADSNWSNSSE